MVNKVKHTLLCGSVLAAVAGLWLPAEAQANTKDLATAGSWTAFGGTSDDGTPVCGIIERGHDQRALTFKWYKGNNYFTVQIFKPTWNIPSGTHVKVEMKIGDYTPWSADALGASNMVEFHVSIASEPQWENELKNSQTYYLAFPSGSEPEWEGTLSGAAPIFSKMGECIRILNAFDNTAPNRPTEPFGSNTASPPTQPFGTPPTPHVTQPFGHEHTDSNTNGGTKIQDNRTKFY